MGSVYNGELVTSRHDDSEYLAMVNVYMDYIKTHKENVLKAFYYLSNKLIETDLLGIKTSMIIAQLGEEVKAHDDSKYSNEEFEPYRRHFDPTEKEKMIDKDNEEIAKLVEEEYEKAWEHHYKNNKHHPEYWRFVERKDGNVVPIDTPSEVGEEMDLVSLLHMVCDWSGMSLKFRNKLSPVSWYNTQAKDERAVLNPKTKEALKIILEKIYNEEVLDEIEER